MSDAPSGPPRGPGGASEVLQLVQPPEGVRLVGQTPSRTGEGGQGIVARYSDGTTVSAMVNSDGSVTVLFFRGGEMLPAIPLADAADPHRRFTWRSP
jgi:hypothetical protein